MLSVGSFVLRMAFWDPFALPSAFAPASRVFHRCHKLRTPGLPFSLQK